LLKVCNFFYFCQVPLCHTTLWPSSKQRTSARFQRRQQNETEWKDRPGFVSIFGVRIQSRRSGCFSHCFSYCHWLCSQIPANGAALHSKLLSWFVTRTNA